MNTKQNTIRKLNQKQTQSIFQFLQVQIQRENKISSSRYNLIARTNSDNPRRAQKHF